MNCTYTDFSLTCNKCGTPSKPFLMSLQNFSPYAYGTWYTHRKGRVVIVCMELSCHAVTKQKMRKTI